MLVVSASLALLLGVSDTREHDCGGPWSLSHFSLCLPMLDGYLLQDVHFLTGYYQIQLLVVGLCRDQAGVCDLCVVLMLYIQWQVGAPTMA